LFFTNFIDFVDCRPIIRKDKKQTEKKKIKIQKQHKKTNLKNTYINKINLLISEPPEPVEKKQKKLHIESMADLANLRNKPPFDKYEEDPIKRVKSYNINSNEFGLEDRKLIRNRESARNSRKRKKIYIELLENKVSDLSAELTDTKALVFENQKNYQNLCVQNKVNEQVYNARQIFEILENAIKSRQNYSQIQTILESIKVSIRFLFLFFKIF